MHASYREYDELIRNYADSIANSTSSPPLVMIDVYPSFEELGNPSTLYDDDELHLSSAGYEYWSIWTSRALSNNSPRCVRWSLLASLELGCANPMTESLVSVTNGTLHLADSQPDYNQQSSQPTGKVITRPSNSPTIENKLTGYDVVEADTAESTSSPSNSLTMKSKVTIDEVDEAATSESTSILTSKGDIEATNLHIWFLSWLGWSVLLF